MLIRLLFCILGIVFFPGIKSSQPTKSFQDYREAIDAIYSITVRLEALLTSNSTQQKNFLVSPLSAAIVIGQLMIGAEGEFREELYNLLSIPKEHQNDTIIKYSSQNGTSSQTIPYGLLHLQLGSLMRKFKKISAGNNSFTLEVSNAFFYNSPLRLKESFKRPLVDFYDTDVVPVNFTTEPAVCQKTINDWGFSHTNGLIKNILSVCIFLIFVL